MSAPAGCTDPDKHPLDCTCEGTTVIEQNDDGTTTRTDDFKPESKEGADIKTSPDKQGWPDIETKEG